MCFRMNCLPSDPRVLIDYKSPHSPAKNSPTSYCSKVIYRPLFVLGRNSVIRINEENEGYNYGPRSRPVTGCTVFCLIHTVPSEVYMYIVLSLYKGIFASGCGKDAKSGVGEELNALNGFMAQTILI